MRIRALDYLRSLLAATESADPRGPVEVSEDFIIPVLEIGRFLPKADAIFPTDPSGLPPSDSFTPLGNGRIRSVVIANPGAGIEIIQIVPGGVAWEPITLRATYVASATAATRVPRLVFNDAAGREFARMPNLLQVLATQSVIHTWGAGINSRQSAGGLLEIGTDWPNRVFIGPGGRLQTTTQLIQAGDTWIDVTLSVREYAVA